MLLYFCLATMLAQVVLLGYVAFNWQINRTRMIQALAILQNVDLFALKEDALGDRDDPTTEQVSHEQIMETRALKVHHLELREQALKNGLSELAFEQRKLAEDRKRYQQVHDAWKAALISQSEGAIATGREDVGLILEGAKAPQAKQLIMNMLDNDELDKVVALLVGMIDIKRGKIIAEFKTAAEVEQMSEILRRIDQGIPDAALPEETLSQLEQPGIAGP